MKNCATIFSIAFNFIMLNANAQIISPNGDNIFHYNGLADVNFRFADRGTGGRALVHDNGNTLVLNFGSDFSGGTRIGNDVYFKDGGNSFIYSGNFGIGTAVPKERLSVNGKIRALEVKVEASNWPDYVFSKDYKPLSLLDLEKFIKINKHLPEVPTADAVRLDGIALGEMNKILLKKIEELTLYLIEKEKAIKEIEARQLKTEQLLKKLMEQ
jgi:hypothetical protein